LRESDRSLQSDIDFGRRVRDVVQGLGRRRSTLARVVHISAGTSDEPSQTRRFRREPAAR
jgi:hypothetical protein